MNQFNFKSQICTSREQSERLLALGLKKETADMGWVKLLEGDGYVMAIAEDYSFIDIPAWSLHRLIEMIQVVCSRITMVHSLVHVENHMPYVDCRSDFEDNLYDNLINCIEWLIKVGYFNKEFLV